MQKTSITLPEIKLVGIKTRTNNSNEMISEKAKIGSTIAKYYNNNLVAKIPNRTKAGVTYCVYTEYENNEHGEYTYFVGEEIDSFDNIAPDLVTLTIPLNAYSKFECGPGEMPIVCINAWQKIWQMQDTEIGGKRNYVADFEIYDERAKDPKNTVLDIYIGIEK